MAHDPNSTETNSGNESKGYTFGLEGDLFIWVVGTLFIGISLFTVLFTICGLGPIESLIVVALPSAPIFFWVFQLRQGKPPGYDRDWLEQIVNGHAWGYDHRHQPTVKKNTFHR